MPLSDTIPAYPAADILEEGAHAFLEGAARIGRQLARDAVWADSRCNWTGWSMGAPEGAPRAVYRAFDGTFYDGTAGIAYFLGHLQHLQPDSLIERTLDGALEQALNAGHRHADNGRHGVYSGAAGIAHAALTVGRLLDCESWMERGLALLERCTDYPCPNSDADLLAGYAGTVPVLIAAGRAFRRDDFLAAAMIQAERIQAMAVPGQHGLSWPGPMPCHHNLLGYSHGVSGYAVALLEAADATGRLDFAETARKALKTERAFFSRAFGNWPDFRRAEWQPDASTSSFMVAWCHGAVGIGVARLRMLDLTPGDPDAVTDLDAATTTAQRFLATPPGAAIPDYGLCHGAMGAADFLLMAGRRRRDDALTQEARRLGTTALDTHSRTGRPWPCGANLPGETPGLMLGLAGIGHTFLRLYRDAVPSPLLIHPAPALKTEPASVS